MDLERIRKLSTSPNGYIVIPADELTELAAASSHKDEGVTLGVDAHKGTKDKLSIKTSVLRQLVAGLPAEPTPEPPKTVDVPAKPSTAPITKPASNEK